MDNLIEDILSNSDIYNYAIRLLSKRDYSEFNLRRKLQSKCDSSAVIDGVISKVQALGYQSDQRYIQHFISYSIAQKKGPIWIQAKLREKGLNGSQVENILGDIDVEWQSLADELLLGKFKATCVDQKDKSRRFRFLISRGFSSDIAIRAIENQEKHFLSE